jgi:hypothetical protein
MPVRDHALCRPVSPASNDALSRNVTPWLFAPPGGFDKRRLRVIDQPAAADRKRRSESNRDHTLLLVTVGLRDA